MMQTSSGADVQQVAGKVPARGALPLVSILIPAYNAKRWISRSIESALDQSWPRCEILVMDDGSTDGTREVANRHQGRFVKILSQSNAGAAAARNALLRSAQGDYIQWLDADDLLHPHKIELQLRGAEPGHRAEVLFTSAWGRFFSRAKQARFVSDSLWETLAPVDWLSRKFVNNAFMMPAAWLVSRRLTTRAGLWNEQLTLDDDGEYMCRAVAASKQVTFVPDARCLYRIGNTSSLSWQKSNKALTSAYQSMTLCISHLLGLEDSARTRAACLRFVQDNFGLFYPEHVDLSERCVALAQSLGGSVHAPRERPHFKLFRTVFGWPAAKATRSRIDYSRLLAAKLLENLNALGQLAPPRA